MNLAVFASGNGSNFQAILDKTNDGYIKAEIKLVVCDKLEAMVIKRAQKAGIDVFSFNPKDFKCKQEYEKIILNKLLDYKIDFIILGGYMRLIGETILFAYKNKIINIHPSLLPAFKGKNALEQAYAYGVKVMGVSIHFVNHELDGGKIIAQKAFDITGMDKSGIETKIHEIEHELYPKVIKEIVEGKI